MFLAVNATSIPAMLQTFQNEWDALMVETFELRKQLDQCRNELATALYKQDAAERTIARLIRERDHAREEARAGGKRQLGMSGGGGVDDNDVAPMEIEGGGLSADQENMLESKAASLIQKRKSRAIPPSTASVKEVAKLHEVYASPDQKAKLVTVTSSPDQGLLAVGTASGSVCLYDTSSTKISGSFQAHSKAVNSVGFAMGINALVTGSADNTVKIWKAQGSSYAAVHSMTGVHSDSVVGISVHPCDTFFASASRDQTWAFVDVQAGATVYSVVGTEAGSFSSLQFHPDGLLLVTAGEDPQYHIRLWDIKSKENVISFKGHTGRVNDICFSENGYYFATASSDKTVKLWDLRNLEDPMFVNEKSDSEMMAVSFDRSGEYLASCGKDVQVYNVKSSVNTVEHIVRLSGHKGSVNGLAWGKDAKSLHTISSDKTLRSWNI